VPDEGPRYRTILQKIEKVRHLQQGLTREDYDPILYSEDYEAVYEPRALGFPGLRHFHTRIKGNWKETLISVYRKSLVDRRTLKDNRNCCQ
jgi:hypothetical protein